MVKSIKQIQQDLENLARETQKISLELYHYYIDYLTLLSRATKQQLVLASYQLCTQIYPDSFVALTFSERQKLQSQIQEIGRSLETQLLGILQESKKRKFSVNILEEMLLSSPEPSQEEEVDQQEEPSFAHPEELMLWCKHIEENIARGLEQISEKTNQCLQASNVVKSGLPPKLLEMAVQAEENGMPVGNSPNLLQLLVEAKSRDDQGSTPKDSDAKITKITAIHLRLSDIEFANPSLTLARKKLRQILEKVVTLRQQYQQATRDYAIAQAEAAWRSSWMEDIS